jgi:hypothetical protein
MNPSITAEELAALHLDRSRLGEDATLLAGRGGRLGDAAPAAKVAWPPAAQD